MIPLNKNLTPLRRSAIRAYTNLARQTPGCAMLTIGEPDFDTPEVISQAAWQALQAGQTHYSPNQGTESLRQRIARFETDRGLPCKAEDVLVTVGATGGLFTALLGILNPGDEVIVPMPAFVLYETIITIAGAKLVPLDVTKTGYQITQEALDAAITPKTKAIVLNSPNNPTGVALNAESLANVKRAILGKPVFLICDNVYNQLVYKPCPDISLDGEIREQLIYCQSFSKPYAMTGWRIGYLICPDYVMDRLVLLGAAQIASVPAFIQAAAEKALDTSVEGMLDVYTRRREYVVERLRSMNLSFPEPDGAFYVFIDISGFGLDDDTFCQRMIKEGKVAAVPGSCFGAPGHIRLSYCYSDDELKTGLDRLERFVETLRNEL